MWQFYFFFIFHQICLVPLPTFFCTNVLDLEHGQNSWLSWMSYYVNFLFEQRIQNIYIYLRVWTTDSCRSTYQGLKAKWSIGETASVVRGVTGSHGAPFWSKYPVWNHSILEMGRRWLTVKYFVPKWVSQRLATCPSFSTQSTFFEHNFTFIFFVWSLPPFFAPLFAICSPSLKKT